MCWILLLCESIIAVRIILSLNWYPQARAGGFLVPIINQKLSSWEISFGSLSPWLWERWDSDENCNPWSRMSGPGHYYHHHCLFIWVWPESQTRDHHLRQELFVVIFTALCQQELNLFKPKLVKYQEKASTCPKNFIFMFNEMRAGQKNKKSPFSIQTNPYTATALCP